MYWMNFALVASVTPKSDLRYSHPPGLSKFSLLTSSDTQICIKGSKRLNRTKRWTRYEGGMPRVSYTAVGRRSSMHDLKSAVENSEITQNDCTSV